MAIGIVLLYACGFIAGVGGYGDLMIGTIGQVRNGITAPNGIEYLASRISEGTGCIISISNNGDGTLRAPHWDVFEGEVEGSVPQEIGPRQSVALKFHKSKIGAQGDSAQHPPESNL
ncbi:uncharacterized protein LOC106181469 [Lingula anatina]|uniref:Uncharacterized protein LOC106181469 n=1 Tax=Lingula anatina TaxID=7574 RepID=A0A1S3KGE8_LINAN|nr:uncharacterized protein LOC106181469 [Lingula anatina]|eukprot:XP_013421306.1 uncharacterized protein LOC106181469 [Lingula anatina]